MIMPNYDELAQALVKSAYQKIILYFSTETHVVVTQKNRLNVTVP